MRTGLSKEHTIIIIEPRKANKGLLVTDLFIWSDSELFSANFDELKSEVTEY